MDQYHLSYHPPSADPGPSAIGADGRHPAYPAYDGGLHNGQNPPLSRETSFEKPPSSKAPGGKRRREEQQQQMLAAGGNGDAETEAKVKKTRQSQSCDACRARKVKCDRPPPGTVVAGPTKDVCSHCEHLGLPCTFDYVPKKRGPPNLYVRRLQEGQGGTGEGSSTSPAPKSATTPASANTTPAPATAAATAAPEPRVSSSPPNQTTLQAPRVEVYQPSSSTPTFGEPVKQEWAEPTLATSMANAPLRPQQAYQNTRIPTSASSSPTTQAPLYFPSAPATSSPLRSRTFLPPALEPTHSLVSQPPSTHYTSPLHIPQRLAYIQHTHDPRNALDAVIPRPLLYHVIDLYFDYVYCLIPCLHRPSFTHDLNTKREERPGQEEWVAMVLAVVASTLVQLPRSFVAMPRKDVREVVMRCHTKVREYLAMDFVDVTVTRCIILYNSIFVHNQVGHSGMAKGDFGTNYSFLISLRTHEESTYTELSNIEGALRRRMFWLMYGADKTFAAIEGVPVFFHEDDCANVALPDDIDDEYFTEDERLTQPDGYTSTLCGFRYISQMHRLTGEVLDKRRRDKLKAPAGLLLQMRLNEINDLYNRTMSTMDDCPPQLKLDYKNIGTSSVGSLSPDWDVRAKNDIKAIFSDPQGSDMELIKDSYLVQQANIYVTQQLVRFMIIQYRDELLDLQFDEEQGTTNQDYALRPQRPASSQDERDEVIIDLLSILQKIPIKVLAVNSFPIVVKVRFVASTLLDSLDEAGAGVGGPPPLLEVPATMETRAQRAQRNLWKFLNFLSEVEGLYSLQDD
ncbi:hypothetical protein IAT38_007475 [Cryptococcus sp. DSM 104549]